VNHIDNIVWRPGFNDPDPLGLVTFAAYGVATVLCIRAALRRDESPPVQQSKRAWLLFGLVLGFVGLNEQLDLQTLLIQWGRQTAEIHGWYEKRRMVQHAFMVTFSAAVVAGALLVGRQFWTFVKTQWLAVAGAMAVIGYVLVRDASFNHIDDRQGSWWNLKDSLRVGELAGVTAIGIAAWRYARPRKSP
jgi:hypothetical protein